MTPRHLVPLDTGAVQELCDAILLELPSTAEYRHSIAWLELVAFRETRTPHDARRLANALRHVLKRDDLADKVLGLIDQPAGVLGDLAGGRES